MTKASPSIKPSLFMQSYPKALPGPDRKTELSKQEGGDSSLAGKGLTQPPLTLFPLARDQSTMIKVSRCLLQSTSASCSPSPTGSFPEL